MNAPTLYDLDVNYGHPVGPVTLVIRGDGPRWFATFAEHPYLWDQLRCQFPPDAWEYR
jgi:hypothetical protein